jgi:hypothetical protein
LDAEFHWSVDSPQYAPPPSLSEATDAVSSVQVVTLSRRLSEGNGEGAENTEVDDTFAEFDEPVQRWVVEMITRVMMPV